MTIHLRQRSVGHSSHTRGNGATWCGKKLLGDPAYPDEEAARADIQTFNCYGNDVTVASDPAATNCPSCRKAFDSAYDSAFPEGMRPLASFKLDDPDLGAKLKALLVEQGLPPVTIIDTRPPVVR